MARTDRYAATSHQFFEKALRALEEDDLANSLHVTFYEGWLSAEDVRASLELIRELMDRLEPLLEPAA